MIKKLYLLSPKITWKHFKNLQDKLSPNKGIVPIGGDKALWNLLKDCKIYCWYAEEDVNDMMIGLSIPKAKKTLFIK